MIPPEPRRNRQTRPDAVRLVSRRGAIRLLVAGGGAGLATAVAPVGRLLASQAAAGPIIRSILKDLRPDEIGPGAVLFHEHLSVRWGRPQHFTDDVALIAEEVRASRADGIACIVDAGHADIGRSIEALRRIAVESGLPVVASGGYYTQRLYPADLARRSEEALVEELVQDAARHRLGAVGEIGQELGEMTPDERKVFRAVGKAHVRTGLPIFTHSPYLGSRASAKPVPPDAALRQLDLLESMGVAPGHVALGHVCCLDDRTATVAQQIAKRGAFVGFDRVTLDAIVPDAARVVMVRALVDAGHADRLLLSSDFFQEERLKKRGGPGFGQTVTTFAPKLIEAGVPEPTLQRILSDNPRRFLAFAPK